MSWEKGWKFTSGYKKLPFELLAPLTRNVTGPETRSPKDGALLFFVKCFCVILKRMCFQGMRNKPKKIKDSDLHHTQKLMKLSGSKWLSLLISKSLKHPEKKMKDKWSLIFGELSPEKGWSTDGLTESDLRSIHAPVSWSSKKYFCTHYFSFYQWKYCFTCRVSYNSKYNEMLLLNTRGDPMVYLTPLNDTSIEMI